MQIRPFNPTADEYATIVAIHNLNNPNDPAEVTDWQHADATRDPTYPFQREVVEIDGNIVAAGNYGQHSWGFHPRKYYVEIEVHPDHDAAGIREAYLAHLLETLADKDLIALVSGAPEAHAKQIAFLQANGFTETLRYPHSELDITAFDWSRFAGKDQVDGITFCTLSELQAQFPDWQHRLWELDMAIRADVPVPDPYDPPAMEVYLAQTLAPDYFDPAAWFYALDGGVWVGRTGLLVSKDAPHMAHALLTGIRREYRRRGLAIALKLHAVRYAKQAGVVLIESDNEANNPMYHINLKLGFRPVWTWIDFKKPLEHSS